MSRKANVTIQKDNNLWKIIRANGKCTGYSESISETVNTCNAIGYVILNMDYVMEQLYEESKNNKPEETVYNEGTLLIGISSRDGKEYSIVKEDNKFYFRVESKSYEITNDHLIDDIFNVKIKVFEMTNDEVATLINRIIVDCFEEVA